VAAAAAAAPRPEAAAAAASVVPASLHATAPDAVATRSIGEAIGLHTIPDRLALRSAVALVVDGNTGEVLYDKNSRAVLPIASITKLMTAMLVLDARQSLDEPITILEADRDTERFSASRLPVGSRLTRRELLQLALMSSENRAASALARSYPGGDSAFVAAANQKAADIGMRDSVFMDGTGLSAGNVSTARDLAVMVAHAARYPLIARFSTDDRLTVRTAHGSRAFGTTNRLVRNPDWDISLQKTGYINESGNCLVMRGQFDGRNLIMVLLDSHGRYSRLGDAQRLRRWLEG
jgi:D-alanyl-D-alanine endopeptidase (penicillin-binding protein 7)